MSPYAVRNALMLAVLVAVALCVWLVKRRAARLNHVALGRTAFVVPSSPAPAVRQACFVKMTGPRSGPFRPKCTTCPWAGAAVTELHVAEGAARAHGDLLPHRLVENRDTSYGIGIPDHFWS